MKPLQACKIKKKIYGVEEGGRWGEGTSLWKMSTVMAAWVRKIVSWNLQWLEVLLTFVGLGDVNFHYKSGFLKNFWPQFSNFKAHWRVQSLGEGFLFFNDENWYLDNFG